MSNKVIHGNKRGFQDDFNASRDAQGYWQVTCTFWAYSKDDRPPAFCPFEPWQDLPLYEQTENLQAGELFISTTYRALQEENAEGEEEGDTEEDARLSAWTFTRSVSPAPLLQADVFAKDPDGFTTNQKQLDALNLIQSGRVDLSKIEIGKKLFRYSPNDTEFPDNLYPSTSLLKYLGFWSQGIESYYKAFSSFDLTGKADEVLTALVGATQKQFRKTSTNTSKDFAGDTKTTESYTTFYAESSLEFVPPTP